MINETMEREIGRDLGTSFAQEVIDKDLPREWKGLPAHYADKIPRKLRVALNLANLETHAHVEYLRYLEAHSPAPSPDQ